MTVHPPLLCRLKPSFANLGHEIGQIISDAMEKVGEEGKSIEARVRAVRAQAERIAG